MSSHRHPFVLYSARSHNTKQPVSSLVHTLGATQLVEEVRQKEHIPCIPRISTLHSHCSGHSPLPKQGQNRAPPTSQKHARTDNIKGDIAGRSSHLGPNTHTGPDAWPPQLIRRHRKGISCKTKRSALAQRSSCSWTLDRPPQCRCRSHLLFLATESCAHHPGPASPATAQSQTQT